MASQQFSAVILLLLVLGSQAQQLNITSIAIGTLSRDIVPGQNPSYIDVKPTSGPNADSYQVQVQMQNVGEDDRVVSQEDIRVYVGSYDKQVPATAQVLQIDTTGVSILFSYIIDASNCTQLSSHISFSNPIAHRAAD